MNEKLVEYLKLNKDRIVEEWHYRFITQGTKAGMTVVDAHLQTMDGFFLDVVSLLSHHSIEKSSQSGKFDNFSPTNHRHRLPHLMEIFLSGEEVFWDFVIADEDNPFSENEKAGVIAMISAAFKTLTQYHVDHFCTSCVDPLLRAHDQVIGLGQRLSIETMTTRINKGEINDY